MRTKLDSHIERLWQIQAAAAEWSELLRSTGDSVADAEQLVRARQVVQDIEDRLAGYRAK